MAGPGFEFRKDDSRDYMLNVTSPLSEFKIQSVIFFQKVFISYK